VRKDHTLMDGAYSDIPLDELWNGVDDSRWRDSPEATAGATNARNRADAAL